jgi:acetate kinase
MRSTGLSLDDIEKLLCTESGLRALSGGYNDIRDIGTQANQGNVRAQLALSVLAHQTRHWIGAFLAELNGADALVFTAGIGENDSMFRQAVCSDLDQLGIVLDEERNAVTRAKEALISAPDSRVKILVIPTNEELVVAREVKRFLDRHPPQPAPAARKTEHATPLSKIKSKLSTKH